MDIHGVPFVQLSKSGECLSRIGGLSRLCLRPAKCSYPRKEGVWYIADQYQGLGETRLIYGVTSIARTVPIKTTMCQ